MSATIGFGQFKYTGTIINSADGNPIANCVIHTIDKSIITTSDSAGKFNITISTNGEVAILVSSLNCHINARMLAPSENFPPIYVYCPPVNLPVVEIFYQDAYTIVQTAFSRIPELYIDSSYVAYGFYRNYKKINNLFKELTECKVATAMRIDTVDKQLNCNEAYGIRQIRRTLYTIPIADFYDYQLADLFKQNLVYHNEFAPFGVSLFPYGEFSIDSSSTDSTWVISYKLRRFSGENHGVDNYTPRMFPGEAYESGFITINKADFAIVKLIRESIRNQKYQYPEYNNFIMPDLKYTGWFEEGYLELTYEKLNEKYLLKNIFHAYTNSFVHVPTNMRDYIITDYSEWNCDSIGFIIDQTLLTQMEAYQNNEIIKYTYNESDWETTFPWFFVKQETVLAEISRRGNLPQLFTAGGN